MINPTEADARALHAQVERIATGERRKIAANQAGKAAGLAVLAVATFLLGGPLPLAYALCGGVGVQVYEWLWLLSTRPQSVKPWGAER